MSIRAIDRARSGLELASAKLGASAHNTANALTEGERPIRATGEEGADGGVRVRVSRAVAAGVDPVKEAVDQIEAANLYRANLAVIKASDDALGWVLDTLA